MPQLQLTAIIVAMAVISASVLIGQAQDNSALVMNLKEAQRNSTHVIFSWDVDSVYIPSSTYMGFYMYFKFAPPENTYNSYGYDIRSPYISLRISEAVQFNSSRTFQYTMPITYFYNYGYYEYYCIMWVQGNTGTTPSYIYSEQIFTQLGLYIYLEMKIKLKIGQTCSEFLSITTKSFVSSQVYRALRIHCQCTYPYISAMQLLRERLHCAPTGYVTFRVNIQSNDIDYQPSLLNSTLHNWLHNPNISNITIDKYPYTVEPGDCGFIIPDIDAPYCSTSTSDDDPTTASPALNSATACTQAVVSSDNTAVIIAAVFAAMFFILTLGLIGYILAVRRPFKKLTFHDQSSSSGGVSADNHLAQETPYIDPAPNPYMNSGPPAGSTATSSSACATRQKPIYRTPLPNPELQHDAYEPLRM